MPSIRGDLHRAGLLVSLALMLSPTAPASAAPVHITVEKPRGAEFGAGWSIGRGRECFVVTPSHVVEAAPADAVRITDSKGRTGRATLVKQIQDFDAALLRLADDASIECPEDWCDGSGARADIEKAPFLISRKIDTNGRVEIRRLFVASSSAEYLDLEPFDANNRLREGDSGSSLFAGDVLVGMVLSVDTAMGRVQALTQSQLHGLFGADVLPDPQKAVLVEPFYFGRYENPYATLAAREYLVANTPWRVVDAPIEAPSHGVDAAPPIPRGVDYVLTGTLLEVSTTRERNPNYKPPDPRKQERNLGSMLLGAVVDSALGLHESVQFLVVHRIDVQLNLTDANTRQSLMNLERLEFKAPGDNSSPRELEKSAIEKAVGQSVERTLRKYGLLD